MAAKKKTLAKKGKRDALAKASKPVKAMKKGAQKATRPKGHPVGGTHTGIADAAKAVSLEEKLESLSILKHPLVTEKAVNMIEAENKLTFVVDAGANRPLIKRAVETLYKVKVRKVNILRDMKSRKRAIVTLDKAFKAGDVATKLGVI